MDKPFKLYVIFISALICASIGYFIFQGKSLTTQELAARAEANLHQKETIAKTNLDLLSKALKTTRPKELFVSYQGAISDLYKNQGIAVYVYSNDSLCFWTDNQPAIDLNAYTNETNVQLIRIRNGWYEYIKQVDSLHRDYTLVALISIKPEFDFENRYLNNNYSEWLRLPEESKLVTPVNFLKHAVKSKFGPPLFEVYRSEGLHMSSRFITYACFFYVVSFLLFLGLLFVFLKRKLRNEGLFIIVFASACLAIRTVMIYFKIPEVFYHNTLFDAKLFADASSFYFSFLGDVLINSGLIFLLAIMLYKSTYVLVPKNKVTETGVIILSFLLLSAFSLQIRLLIYSLVNNSTISYNINDLFNFSAYSLTGLLCVGLLVFAFYLCLERFIIFLLQRKLLPAALLLSLCGILVIVYLLCEKYGISILEYSWPLLLVIISYFLRKFKASYNFINIGLIILTSTFIVSSLFSKYEQVNKKQTFEALSLSLTDRQDVIAENEFSKISASIKSDPQLKNLLTLLPLSSEQIEQSLRQRNFTGYFERYEILMSLFKNDCTPIFIHLNPVYLNEDYFKQQIEKNGFQTISDDLYFIDKQKESIRYIAKIEIEDVNRNPGKTFHLYVQLEPKLAVNLGAFPDLLLDKSLENKLESKHISYAVYESNKLLSTFGEYQYPLFINSKTFKYSTNDGFEHFVYSPKANTVTVITDKEFGVWGRFTSNSYLFIFFSVVVLFSVWFNSMVIKRSKRFNSLNNRIQFILVSIVVLSLAGVVIGTIWVVNSQFEIKNKKDLILKSQSVLKELQQNIGLQESLEASYKDITTFRLKRLAQLFGSDISLFNKKGVLYATSQPAIYEQGLVSKFMNPLAYMSFRRGIRANYSQRENIGTLKYLSAYIPFYSKNDRLLGYINLPYFARQKDLEKELTAYLTTLINIYTILFAITTLVALLVSNLLTKPLRIIRQQISNIQFGRINEALQWKSNDEIGNLVEEYNNMLIKLEKSSVLLAQSERESAWREMAKQVAHEIKNPLTPMKLNIQHLQRVVETHPEDINERVKKVSQMLIEQIDTLSHIATEFSNFAKLPNTNLEIVNLFDVLQNVTHLFQQNTDCEISLSASESLWVMADKEQCLRIFTNLLKNAEQSVPETRKGKIEIMAYSNETNVTVKVKDNGSGIAEDVKDKLFTPNFTTKTTGTGLGLAMVKNSVVSFNGTITFETELNQGTIFTLVFPLAKK
ncbi:MAG: GHKL domain-containing protein [Burkholderiales bacterium]|nr:GHKL domain-containing protein [Bacteroidia bacterium]